MNKEKIVYVVDVEKFIADFKKFGSGEEIINCFTQGYCYWFAFILKTRFPEGEICYNTLNHFVFKYKNKLYDITGECSDKWDNEYLYLWDEFIKKEANSEHLEVIKQCCIYKNEYAPYGNILLEGKYEKTLISER